MGVGALIQPYISVMHFPSSKHTRKKNNTFCTQTSAMNQAAVPGTNQTTSIQRSSYYFVNTWFTTHSKPFQILSCPIIQKYTRSEKSSFLSDPRLLSILPKRHINWCLAFLESVHSDSIKRRARISRITSKMAYPNKWAAGPTPSSPLNP